LKKEGMLENIELEGLTAKQIYKLGTAARHKTKAAVDEAAKSAESKKFQDALTKQQQDFQTTMQRQLSQQQSTLLSALTKQQQYPTSREPSRERDNYRSHSADHHQRREYPPSDRHNGSSDNRRHFNQDRRPSQDNSAGVAAQHSDRRNQSPRPSHNASTNASSPSSARPGQDATRSSAAVNGK
jgi:hypothetical protein